MLTYNDLDEVTAAFRAHPGEIAGIIVEPVAGNMNLILPKPGFLQGLREACDRNGAVLIFDEVMTGFQAAPSGRAGSVRHCSRPDDARQGHRWRHAGRRVRRAPRDHGEDRAARARSIRREPFRATRLPSRPDWQRLKAIQAPGFYARLAERTLALTTGLVGAARNAGVEFSAQAIGGMFGIYFARTAPETFAAVMACDKDRFNRFFHHMLDAGVYLAPSAFEAGFVSAAHTADDIAETVRLAEASMRATV